VTGRSFPLLAVVGPTGSGKSDLGLRIAEEFSGEVVNCDSLQVYRHFDIGTAKLSPDQRGGIPHHLIDIADPDEVFTAGEYAARARPLLLEIAGRGHLPVIVGGTGFYLRALIDGLFPGPGRDDAVRERLARRHQRRPGSVHRILRRLDPAAAAKIDPRDVKKTIRAVEVCILRQKPISELHAEGRDALRGFRALKIGLDPPRAALYQHLDARCQSMFDAGLVDEVRRILKLGYLPGAKPFESHGYKQVIEFFEHKLTLPEAVCHAKQNTRRYAKRQWTWFHHEREVLWCPGFGNDPAIQRQVLERVSEFVAADSEIP
jgi:tRNA dimethylallyltransferase